MPVEKIVMHLGIALRLRDEVEEEMTAQAAEPGAETHRVAGN
jgi:hypothetical protein